MRRATFSYVLSLPCESLLLEGLCRRTEKRSRALRELHYRLQRYPPPFHCSQIFVFSNIVAFFRFPASKQSAYILGFGEYSFERDFSRHEKKENIAQTIGNRARFHGALCGCGFPSANICSSFNHNRSRYWRFQPVLGKRFISGRKYQIQAMNFTDTSGNPGNEASLGWVTAATRRPAE